MDELRKTKDRVNRILRQAEYRDCLMNDKPLVAAPLNTLIPDDPAEEPFFVLYEIDWSKYGR